MIFTILFLKLKYIMKILSWNISFTPFNTIRYRTIDIISEIKTKKPDIVLLQEVTRESEIIIQESQSLKNYNYYSIHTSSGYWNATLINKNLICNNIRYDSLKLDSIMDREMLIIFLEIKDSLIIIGNVHLESTQSMASIRQNQIKCIENYIGNKLYDICIIGGDTNMLKNEKCLNENLFVDAWKHLGSSRKKCYTYDSTYHHPEKKGRRQRYDRLWVSSKNKKEIQNIEISTHNKLSDHSAIVLNISF